MMRFFKEAWLVLLIMVACGLGLAVVHSSLKDRIKTNETAQVEKAVAEVLGVKQEQMRAEKIELKDSNGKPLMVGKDPVVVYKAMDTSGKLIGWGVPAKCQKSYSGELEVMIGLDPDAQIIVGLEITNCKETPGLGEQVKGDKFRGEFKNKSADTKTSRLRVVKAGEDPGAIECCTGATISSKSVVEAVNDQLQAAQAEIAKMAKDDNESEGRQ